MPASDICLNKEALFYPKSPEDHNNAPLMFNHTVVWGFSLCGLHVGDKDGGMEVRRGTTFPMNPLGPQQLVKF